MSHIDAGETVRAVRYQNTWLQMADLGLSDYQIDLIQNAEGVAGAWPDNVRSYVIRAHLYDPRGEVESMKNMKRLNIVSVREDGRYWLTGKGELYRKALVENLPEVKAPKINLPVVVEDQMDINLGRDGLMVTASKFWYVWTHRDEIRAARDKKWLEGFQNGQKEIDEAITKILEPREPIVLKPEPKVNPYWSEAQQRKNNDLYWMTPDAFWLNPRGILAEPTPAPDWWTVPENYQPKVYIPLSTDELVDQSLLPPPTVGPQGVTGFPGIRQATAEEIAAKHRQKSADMVIDEILAELDRLDAEQDLDYAEYEYSIAKNFDHHDLVMVQYGDEVAGFPTAQEANLWLAAKKQAARMAEQQAYVDENRRQQKLAQDRLLQAAKAKVRGQNDFTDNRGYEYSSYSGSSYDSSGSSSDW